MTFQVTFTISDFRFVLKFASKLMFAVQKYPSPQVPKNSIELELCVIGSVGLYTAVNNGSQFTKSSAPSITLDTKQYFWGGIVAQSAFRVSLRLDCRASQLKWKSLSSGCAVILFFMTVGEIRNTHTRIRNFVRFSMPISGGLAKVNTLKSAKVFSRYYEKFYLNVPFKSVGIISLKRKQVV